MIELKELEINGQVFLVKGEKGADGEKGQDGTFTHSYKEDTQTLSFSNTPLDSLITIKIDVTKLIYDYLDGNISGDGELMDYSFISDYINVSEDNLAHIIKNLVSNIVLLEIKENTVENDYQHLTYASQITNINLSGGVDLNEGLTNISAVIDLTNMFQYIEDVQIARLVFRAVGIETLKVIWYLEVYRNN